MLDGCAPAASVLKGTRCDNAFQWLDSWSIGARSAKAASCTSDEVKEQTASLLNGTMAANCEFGPMGCIDSCKGTGWLDPYSETTLLPAGTDKGTARPAQLREALLPKGAPPPSKEALASLAKGLPGYDSLARCAGPSTQASSRPSLRGAHS